MLLLAGAFILANRGAPAGLAGRRCARVAFYRASAIRGHGAIRRRGRTLQPDLLEKADTGRLATRLRILLMGSGLDRECQHRYTSQRADNRS